MKIKLAMTKVNQYNYHKHNILPTAKSESIQEVVANHIGLHAARLPSPYVTLCSRVNNYSTIMLWDLLHTYRNLIKLRCMRTTLHIVPFDIAPIVHNATLPLRMAKCNVFYKKNKISKKAITILKNTIMEVVKENEVSSTYIEKYINILKPKSKLKDKNIVRMVIKDLWENGELCYINKSRDWEKEDRCYGYTKEYYKNLNLNSIKHKDAIKRLIAYYVKCYGPVTITDMSWWSGIGVTILNKAMSQMSTKIIKVCIDGYNDEYLMTENDFEKFMRFKEFDDEWVELLSYEDPCLKGYYKTRYRYVEDEYYDKAFNQIGEVRNSIIINGKIKGIWRWEKRKQKIEIELFEKVCKKKNKKILNIVSLYESLLLKQ